MKKIITALTITLIFAITFLLTDAQKSMGVSPFNHIKHLRTYFPDNTKITETIDDHSRLYSINFKAVQHFKNTYPDVTNEKWDIVNNGYIASFVSNSGWTRSFYDKKGRWLQTVLQYDETKLPPDVLKLIKSSYEDYSINVVQEISTNRNNREPIYLVYIKHDTTYKTVRVCTGDLEEITLTAE
ncbi:hypothetical protein [Segetibacter koreensis]|uniref:hypothetical protein n=1 Tax=Segetibacter koreensis TaxID=398037 RepID=UPI000373F0C6|nr:hypothetical protein [Segetibacter koreensis]